MRKEKYERWRQIFRSVASGLKVLTLLRRNAKVQSPCGKEIRWWKRRENWKSNHDRKRRYPLSNLLGRREKLVHWASSRFYLITSSAWSGIWLNTAYDWFSIWIPLSNKSHSSHPGQMRWLSWLLVGLVGPPPQCGAAYTCQLARYRWDDHFRPLYSSSTVGIKILTLTSRQTIKASITDCLSCLFPMTAPSSHPLSPPDEKLNPRELVTRCFSPTHSVVDTVWTSSHWLHPAQYSREVACMRASNQVDGWSMTWCIWRRLIWGFQFRFHETAGGFSIYPSKPPNSIERRKG